MIGPGLRRRVQNSITNGAGRINWVMSNIMTNLNQIVFFLSFIKLIPIHIITNIMLPIYRVDYCSIYEKLYVLNCCACCVHYVRAACFACKRYFYSRESAIPASVMAKDASLSGMSGES